LPGSGDRFLDFLRRPGLYDLLIDDDFLLDFALSRLGAWLGFGLGRARPRLSSCGFPLTADCVWQLSRPFGEQLVELAKGDFLRSVAVWHPLQLNQRPSWRRAACACGSSIPGRIAKSAAGVNHKNQCCPL
jgi:hypothetical protein